MPDLSPALASPLVRAPWPDEIPRLSDAFPGVPFAHPMHLRVLVLPSSEANLERLVGVAAIMPASADRPQATLLLRIRDRWLSHPGAHDLLHAIIAEARQAGCTALDAIGVTGEEDSRASLLRSAGFALLPSAKGWRLNLAL